MNAWTWHRWGLRGVDGVRLVDELEKECDPDRAGPPIGERKERRGAGTAGWAVAGPPKR